MADNDNISNLFSSREVAEIKRVSGGGGPTQFQTDKINFNTDNVVFDINIEGENYFLELHILNNIYRTFGTSSTNGGYTFTQPYANISLIIDSGKTFTFVTPLNYTVETDSNNRRITVFDGSYYLGYIPKGFEIVATNIEISSRYYYAFT